MSRTWTILSSHGTVLCYLVTHADATLRTIAAEVNLTERQVARLVKDLVEAEALFVNRRGRRNVYTVNPEAPLRDPLLADVPLGSFIAAIAPLNQSQDIE